MNKQFDLLKSPVHDRSMKSATIRTFIDLPRELHRSIREAAALEESLIPPAGRRINPTNQEIYEAIQFP